MAASEPLSNRIRVGYALPEKKRHTMITPSLVSHAAAAGVDLVPVDLSRPISSQGPFDALLHKLPSASPESFSALASFSAAHPDVPIIDDLAAVRKLSLRSTMLDCVPRHIPSLSVPTQIMVDDIAAIDSSVLNFPIVAKPIDAESGPDSHTLTLVLRPEGLKMLKPHVILQEFVNHGGVVFKVYVVDDLHVQCEKRKSVADVTDEMMKKSEAVVEFSQVSNKPVADEAVDKAVPPPKKFVETVAKELRKELGLNLFNFDLIRHTRVEEEKYLVIDINYFPGYAKMPGYEKVLTDFLLDVVRKKREPRAHSIDANSETK